MSESTGTLRVKRQSNCAMSIVEISQDGRYVKISNGSNSKDFDLSEWSMERKHPRGSSTFSFPKGTKVNKGSQLTIWSANSADEMQKGDLVGPVSTCKNWGCGNGDLFLKNKDGEVKASSSMAYEVKQ